MSKAHRIIAACALCVLLPALGGCSSVFIQPRVGSDQVAVKEASQVANCRFKGNITVSVLSHVSFISRSNDAVEANLLQLARNGAVDAGADTVVMGNSPDFGKRSYGMYRCRP